MEKKRTLLLSSLPRCDVSPCRSFGGDRTRQLTNPFNKTFLKYFPEQEGVPTGWWVDCV